MRIKFKFISTVSQFCSVTTGFICLYSVVLLCANDINKKKANQREISMLNRIVVSKLFFLNFLNSMPMTPLDREESFL